MIGHNNFHVNRGWFELFASSASNEPLLLARDEETLLIILLVVLLDHGDKTVAVLSAYGLMLQSIQMVMVCVSSKLNQFFTI